MGEYIPYLGKVPGCRKNSFLLYGYKDILFSLKITYTGYFLNCYVYGNHSWFCSEIIEKLLDAEKLPDDINCKKYAINKLQLVAYRLLKAEQSTL